MNQLEASLINKKCDVRGMYKADVTKSTIYLIRDISTKEIVVQHRIQQFNSHKAIFSTKSYAQKLLNNLNEEELNYEIIEYTATK